jgi:putative ABC transport system ATP-binding protein
MDDQFPVIRVRNLTKLYQLGKQKVPALRGVSLDINRGEFVAIMGPSGSGKSTFLNLIGLLDRPSSGIYELDGISVSRMNPAQLATVRNHKLGFVFQGFNLMPHLSAEANVEVPMVYSGIPAKERRRRARLMLRQVGLGQRIDHKPTELSGGQQQRVAIARALINRPAVLLADEPTGNLDSHTSVEILAIFQALNEIGITIMMVTHEPDIAAYARRQVTFRDGVVERDIRIETPRQAAMDLQAPPAVHHLPSADSSTPAEVRP